MVFLTEFVSEVESFITNSINRIEQFVTDNMNEIGLFIGIIALIFSIVVFFIEEKESKKFKNDLKEIRIDLGLNEAYNILLEEWINLSKDQQEILKYIYLSQNECADNLLKSKFYLASPAINNLVKKKWIENIKNNVSIPKNKLWFLKHQMKDES